MASSTNAGTNVGPAVPDVSTNPVSTKPFKLGQEVTVTNSGKNYAAKITGIQVTYTDTAPTIFSNTEVLTDDSVITVAQAGAGRRRTNRKRRSSRRN
jgi:hypothetical protein